MKTKSLKSAKVRNAVKVALGTTAAVPLMFSAMPASAQSNAIQNLRQQVNQLEHRLDMLQDQQGEEDMLQIGETSVSFSGYIKLDTIYDFAANQGTTLLPIDVDDYGQPNFDEDANLGWTAKQTRLTISTTTPTAMGDVNGTIQMDMYGEGFGFSSGGEPRVRLAYLTWNNWLIGRYWSAFENFNYGTSLNFAGPAGQVFTRQEQIRYTFHFPSGSSLAVSLEDGQLDAGAVLGAEDQGSAVPDLALHYSGSAGMFSYDLAAIGRSIKANPPAGEEDTLFGWGVTAGGTLSLSTGTTFMLQASYGDGVGRYIYGPSYGTPAAYFDASGDLQGVKVWSAIATVSQKLSPKLTANLVFGYGQKNVDASFDPSGTGVLDVRRFKPDEGTVSGTSLTVNMLYSPVDPLTFGIEYDRVHREVDPDNGSGIDGSANRVQFSTIYHF